MKLKNYGMAALMCLTASNMTIASDSTSKETELLKVSATARVDWQENAVDSKEIDSNSGFTGKYLMLRLDGTILPGLQYSWRQRLNKMHKDANFFDATDWIYLSYTTGDWKVSGGKEVVAIGGWEYDRNPVNIFDFSVFTGNIACYQFGVSGSYTIKGNDTLHAQIVQSPFHTASNRNMYGYNLMWSATHGIFSPLWSANLMEYDKGRYISYISLGNRFKVKDWELELDLMNRAADHQTFFFKDCSVVAELAWMPTSRWRIHGKYSYDVNRSGTDADLCVLNGTELNMAGGGVEFYPLKKDKYSLRLHAACYYSWGHNANTADLMQDKSLFGNVGLTWDMDIFSLKK